MAAHMTGEQPPEPAGGRAGPAGAAAGRGAHRPTQHLARWLLEPWFTPFALVNGSAVGLTPILLPLVAVRYGVGHVGLVMGAFNLGGLPASARYRKWFGLLPYAGFGVGWGACFTMLPAPDSCRVLRAAGPGQGARSAREAAPRR